MKTVNLTKRNREKTSQKRPFLAKISDLNTGICGLGRHRSAAISAPKSHAIAFLTPWGHVGLDRWLWSGQIHLPWPSRALKMDQKNCRKFGPAVQPAATLWQVCGVMPATPEAIKSTTDAAGHAGENRNTFIGFDGLEIDSITTFPL